MHKTVTFYQLSISIDLRLTKQVYNVGVSMPLLKQSTGNTFITHALRMNGT